jgi:preprotein translocase subunit SecD
MKKHGFQVFTTICFLVISAYYLWPTARTYLYNREMSRLSGEELEAYLDENRLAIGQTEEKALKLGLDLQGGMHVTLEVDVESLVRGLATETDAAFEAVLATTRERVAETDEPFVAAFVSEFERRDPNARLSRYYRSAEREITRRSENSAVSSYLEAEADAAVARAMEIIRDRVDRYGVTEPSIQRQGARRVVVELPGIDDPERVKALLRGTARLEFRLMAEPADLLTSLQEIIDYYEPDSTAGAADSAAADTTLGLDGLLGVEDESSTNPLLQVMSPAGQGVVFAAVTKVDSAKANQLLRDPVVQGLLPPGIVLMYTSSNVGLDADGNEVFYLLGVRSDVEMSGEVVVDASVDFDQITNLPQVAMSMNPEGANIWLRLTGANVGKQVAIVLDNVVYSYPSINERIPSGRTTISGLESQAEAQDIVTILKSGALPAPVQIVEERTVGPSLGAASVRNGTKSVIVGLVVVALFMLVYYRSAGGVAIVALILSIFFLFGVLAAFNATLTLPGIAGIVLAIGMAVDANVLIYERIREEHDSGKTLKTAVDVGFAKAFSAIADGNITTFFIGVILYSFGVGPIKGFAVTLMAGILSSMFCAIVVSRIIFDYFVIDRKASVDFG